MASDDWVEDFFERQYSSYDEFDRYFQQFKDRTYSVFRKKTSETAEKTNLKTKYKIAPEFRYSRVVFVCTHFGQPVYRGKGIQTRTKHSATGCEACFTLNYDYREKVLRIKKHNVHHNHPTTADTYAKELQTKRLTSNQKEELKEIIALNPKNENLMHMINVKYAKSLSLTDVRHLKSKLQSSKVIDDVNDLVDNMDELEKHGKVRMVLSQGSESDAAFVDIVAFSTFEMIECFKTFPEVIYMDGTYKSNKNGYPLYQIMVEDGSGQGRTVFYAFVRLETTEILSFMMRIFADFMGNSTSNIRYAMTDKDNAEITAIKKNLPHVQTLLCAFHVHKAMKLKISKIAKDKNSKLKLHGLSYKLVTTTDVACFHKTLEHIKMISPIFFSYLEEHWINCIDTWAYHTRLDISNFCNDTNNKCEGENRRLKNILSGNASIGVAVKKLLLHSVLQQKEMMGAATTELVSTWLFRDEQPELKALYQKFTGYSVSLMIREHNQTGVIANVINEGENGFEVQETSGTNYILQGEPLTCRCPFFKQTTLPCIHCVSVVKAFQLPLTILISDFNRWLKTNFVGDPLDILRNPSSVTIANVVSPEAQHHRTEVALSRLSFLLKSCGTRPFLERITILESLLDVWEANGLVCLNTESDKTDTSAFVDATSVEGDGVEVVECVGDGIDVVEFVERDGVVDDGIDAVKFVERNGVDVVGDGIDVVEFIKRDGVDVDDGIDVVEFIERDGVNIDDGIDADQFVDDTSIGIERDGSDAGGGNSIVREENSSEDITLEAARGLNIKMFSIKRRGRPRELKTKKVRKVKRLMISKKTCYICFKDHEEINPVVCLRCPRLYHQACLGIPAIEQFVCSFCL